MLNSFIAATTLAVGPGALEAKPVSVSLFKNGFAVVTREAKLGGSGDFVLDELPQAVLGTLWITASKGVRLEEVVVGTEEKKIDVPAGTMDDILRINVGKTLTF